MVFGAMTLTLLAFTAWFLANCPFETGFSFVFLLPVLLASIYVCLQPGRFRPALATVTTFTMLFFYVAPMIQLVADPEYFVNTMPVTASDVLFANAVTTIFGGVLLLTYTKGGVRREVGAAAPVTTADMRLTTNLICVLALFAAAWGLSGLKASLLFDDSQQTNDDAIALMLKHKVVFMLPFLALCLKLLEPGGRRRLAIIAVLFFAVLATKNPLYDRRNALGPVYISIAVLLVPSLLNSSRRYFMFLVALVVIAFPAVSILTHMGRSLWIDGNLPEEGIGGVIFGHMVDVHYDAWSSIVAAREMVHVHGLSLGRQLLGSFLFFVPRSIWSSKPIASGYEVGDYLMERHYMWFDNLSTTLPAEGYLDFGIVGVVLFAMLLALYCRWLDLRAVSRRSLDSISAVYFSAYLMFVLRGSLLPAVAYGIGAYICLRITPSVLHGALAILRRASKNAARPAKSVVPT